MLWGSRQRDRVDTSQRKRLFRRFWRSTQRAGLRGKRRQGEENIMATMKAVQIHEYGDVDVLKYGDVERPEPRAGEVLVRVRAAGINQVDAVSRQFPVPVTSGAKGLPYILGWDISGEVVALGAGVTQFAVGDEVYGMSRFPGEAKAY